MRDNILSISLNYSENIRRDELIYQYSRTERVLRAMRQNTFDAVLTAEVQKPEGTDSVIAEAAQEARNYTAEISGRYDPVLSTSESAGKYFASMRMRSLRRA